MTRLAPHEFDDISTYHHVTNATTSFHIFLQPLQSVAGLLEGFDILAEGESCETLADAAMFLTIELCHMMCVRAACSGIGRSPLTSLTGIEETPSSIAMNQQALINDT